MYRRCSSFIFLRPGSRRHNSRRLISVPNPGLPTDNRILVKLRPRVALRAAESRANLRPLRMPVAGAPDAFAIGAEPQWFLADLPDGAATPWDLAHARVAD